MYVIIVPNLIPLFDVDTMGCVAKKVSKTKQYR